MTHKTKAIILRTLPYGETSIIVTAYTELFGVQCYFIKGVRKHSKKNPNSIAHFQPGSILDMVVHHQAEKNLQFIREFQWGYLYQNLHADIKRNAVGMFLIELLQRGLKQPETHPDLFAFIESTLIRLDTGSEIFTANLSLFFLLSFGSHLGFRIQGQYGPRTPVVDLQEGRYVADVPLHPYFLAGEQANITSRINQSPDFEGIETLELNIRLRRELLEAYLQFIRLHIEDFGESRSLKILQEILN